MITETYPEVGVWYHYPEKAQKFMITAIDENAATIEIQYFDGTIDEIDLDAWYTLDMGRVAAPEDWTGPIDNIEKDDLNPVGTEMRREDWAEPYDEVAEKRRAIPGRPDEDEYEEDEVDWDNDWPEEESWGERE